MFDKKHAELERWWQSPQGQMVMEAEKEVMTKLTSPFTGYHQLQVGGVEALPALNKFLSCTLLSRDGDVNAHSQSLPFKCRSIDNLVLQHVLEFQAAPHQVLREAERVLTADGKLLLFCFSPFSLWGLQRLFSWQDKVPWCGKFYSQTRLKDWLALLNFEIIEHHQLLFRPTFESGKWLSRTLFFERWGKRLWPYFGGVSLMVTTKRTIPLTPVRAKTLQKQIFPGTRLVNKPVTRDNPNG